MSDIDPVEFGRMQANVETLLAADKKKTELLEAMNVSIQGIERRFSEMKGSRKLLFTLGSMLTGAGGLVGWLVHEFSKR